MGGHSPPGPRRLAGPATDLGDDVRLPRRRLPWLALPLAALALAACSAPAGPLPVAGPTAQVLPFPGAAAGPADAAHTTVAVERAACEAFAGPATPLAPPSSPEPARLAPGRCYDLHLGDTPTSLALVVPRTGEWSVILDVAHFFLAFGPDQGVAFEVEAGTESPACAGIARHAVFWLEQGQDYRLEFAARARGRLKLFVGETHPAP